MEGLKVSEADLVLYIHPSKSKNVSQSISTELSSMLFKYNETFDGVLLAYETSTKSELAKILPGLHPFFGVRLRAQLLLFDPKADMLLEGKVVKLTEQSIHVVILGFSSATIVEEDIREEFEYKVKHGKEVFASKFNKRHKIGIGSFIRFVMKSFDEEILHMLGSLLPSNTGSVSWLDKSAEDAEAESNKKKRKGSEMMERDEDTVDEDTSSVKTENRAKSKKHRSRDS